MNCRRCKYYAVLDSPRIDEVCKTELLFGKDYIGKYKTFANPKTRNSNGDCKYFEKAPEKQKFLFWEVDYCTPILNFGEWPKFYEEEERDA